MQVQKMWRFAQPFAVVSNMLDKDIAHNWKSRKMTNFKMIDLTNENEFKGKPQQLIRRKPCQKIQSKNADKYAVDAENVSKIDNMKTLLSKSNSFQKTEKENIEELNQCQSILQEPIKKKDDLV